MVASICVLGSVRCTRDGAPIELAGEQQRRLLSILASMEGDVRAEQLADLLSMSMTSLRTAVSRLRAKVGDDVVITNGTSYRLGVSVDAWEFAATMASLAMSANPLTELETALGLWAGNAFDEFSHESWAHAEAARLNELRSVATEDLAALWIAHDRAGEAVALLERHVSDHPHRDRARGLLLQGLMCEGRQADALRSFNDYRTFLAAETATSPSPHVHEIEQRAAVGGDDEREHVVASLRSRGLWRDQGTPDRPAVVAPTGEVTFLFTDIEGSTRLWVRDEAAMSASTQVHEQIIRAAIDQHGGYIFNTAGDSFAVAFDSAPDAVATAIVIQNELANAIWPGPVLRVRIGLHRGRVEARKGDYFGLAVNTASRVEDAGHGGQILITDVVKEAAGVTAIDLGTHELRDVAEPIRLYQVGPGSFPPLRVVQPQLHNLPVRPTSLIGRTLDIAHARQQLGESRLVTMTALGGCGKTRLAIAVGEAELRHRPDGVWFVDLTAVVDGTNLAAAIAESVGLNLTSGDPTPQVINYLADKDTLIVLDNCEHVIDDCADFAELFLVSPGPATILATSREPLDVDGERVIMVSALGSDGASSSGVQLFVDRATAIEPGFELTEANEATVSAICNRLDGIPLAIELAAVRITMMSPAELLVGLDERFTLLSGGRRRQRLRTLGTALDWSYDHLDTQDQAMFRALGVFVDGFDLAAAAAVSGVSPTATLQAVESLQLKSLVVRDFSAETTRFRLLETVKAYVEERLWTADEAATFQDRHLAFFHRAATEHGRECQGRLQVGSQLRRDTSNISAAFERAAATSEWVAGSELLLGTSMAYFMSTRVLEFRRLLTHAFENCPTTDESLRDYLSVQLFFAAGKLQDLMGVEQQAEILAASSSASFRSLGRSTLDSLRVLRQGPSADWANDDAAELADRDGIGGDGNVVQFALAYAASQTVTRELIAANYDAALAAGDAVLDLADGDGGARSFLHVGAANALAMCHLLSGRPADALATIDWLDEFDLPYYDGLEVMALVHLERGDIEAAIIYVKRQCLRGASGRFKNECSDSVLLLASLAHARGDDDHAVDLLLQMGSARLPATVAYARHLAARLDIADEYAQAAREAVSAQERDGLQGSVAIIATLRRELAVLGWD